MNRHWNYQDYVNHLSHKNKIVRRWAFSAVENHYPNRFTDEVCNLIGDEDEHLACASPRYLAKFGAVQHAPLILESFKKSEGNVPSNCAEALGDMHYDLALDTMLEYFSTVKNSETFLGILDYLGKIRHDNSRAALQSAVAQIKDTIILGSAVTNLLRHNNPDDVSIVMDRYLDLFAEDNHDDTYLRDISYPLGGAEYFRNLTEFNRNDILNKPDEIIGNLISKYSAIELDAGFRDDLIKALGSNLYGDFSSMIMFEARSVLNSRYSEGLPPLWLEESFEQDKMSVALLEEISKRTPILKRIKESKESCRNIISLTLSVYFAIKEREVYLTALSPEAGVEDLISALKNSGPSLPKPIQNKIKQVTPIAELKNALTENLMTWGDIWAVRLMGQIGNEAFVPTLLHILRSTDSLDHIYSDAITAMNALDESADEAILYAIENRELSGWESFPILSYLPYSEAYNIALKRWEDEDNDMDSYELFVICLKGIGDPRGIEKLQQIYADENDAIYVGTALECLGMIHMVDIPEMPNIFKKRKEQEERQNARVKELSALFSNYRKNMEQAKLEDGEKVVPFKRDSPKVGRNDPCPCGSGKKYKKCCLNKTSVH
jgi:HEAT repeat protein